MTLERIADWILLVIAVVIWLISVRNLRMTRRETLQIRREIAESEAREAERIATEEALGMILQLRSENRRRESDKSVN